MIVAVGVIANVGVTVAEAAVAVRSAERVSVAAASVPDDAIRAAVAVRVIASIVGSNVGCTVGGGSSDGRARAGAKFTTAGIRTTASMASAMGRTRVALFISAMIARRNYAARGSCAANDPVQAVAVQRVRDCYGTRRRVERGRAEGQAVAADAKVVEHNLYIL